jgi:hypothetical protein
MDLKKILMLSGKSGLFKLISNGKNTLIVESLTEKNRFPVFASTRATTLHDICLFTENEDMPLSKAFERIYHFTGKLPVVDAVAMDSGALKEFLGKIIPEYDRERVHVSDIKKLFSWYNLLEENNLLDFEEETKPSDAENKTDGSETENKERLQ